MRINPTRSLGTLASICTVSLITASAHAVLIVDEQFNGYGDAQTQWTDGVNVFGSAAIPTQPGRGLTGDWRARSTVHPFPNPPGAPIPSLSRAVFVENTPVDPINHNATNLDFGALVNANGLLRQMLPNFSTTAHTVGAEIDTAVTIPTGSSLYGSYVFRIHKRDGATGGGGNMRVNETNLTNSVRHFSTAPDSTNASNATAAAGSQASVTFTNSTSVPALETNYLMLWENTNLGAAGHTITAWTLTLDQFNHFKTGGLTTAELNSATIGTGATNVFARVSDTETTVARLLDGYFLMFGAFRTGTNADIQLSYDAVRIGTEGLDEVTPIPEPASLALALAGVAMMWKRRRA